MWPLRTAKARPPMAYRLKRLWRRRGIRRMALVHAPAAILLVGGFLLASSPRVHTLVDERLSAAYRTLTAQPGFAIGEIVVSGASPVVEAEIRAGLFDVIGASSLALDPEALLRRIKGLGWIARASVTLEAPSLLRVDVTEREPAAVWRVDGELWLIDREGARIAALFGRDDYPRLPLLVGHGAEQAVPEALDLIEAAGSIAARLRGLVRVGERRWDLVLDRGLVVKLPMVQPDDGIDAPRQALRRTRDMHDRYGLLDKDLAFVDMRLPARPTARLTPRAAEARANTQRAGDRG